MKFKEAKELINNAPEAAEEEIPEEERNMDYVDDPVEKEPVIKKIWIKAKKPLRHASKVIGETAIMTVTVVLISEVLSRILPGADDAVKDAAEGAAEAAKNAIEEGSIAEKAEEILDE